MPYIEQKLRSRFIADEKLGVDAKMPDNVGELNYLITRICHAYIERHGEKYQHYNDIIGALECCKLELYRRKITPYEEIKKELNGDV